MAVFNQKGRSRQTGDTAADIKAFLSSMPLGFRV